MFFLSVLAADEMAWESVETVKKSIFASPFFPEQLTFSDVLGIVSVILAIISIILSLVIYKLSNDTSEKLAEEAARRAFEKKYNAEERTTVEMSKIVNLNKEQCKTVKKLINQLIKRAKKNSITDPWVHAASFPIQLKNEFNEEETVRLMYEWKDKEFISWTGTLENSTKVFILRGDLIIEDIDSR